MTGNTLPISASIITLNEGRNIRDCLESVDFCREKVVVDSQSTDRTREIAEELGARVYERPFYTFIYRYFLRLGILDGFPGFMVSAGGAMACWAKYLFLREIGADD